MRNKGKILVFSILFFLTLYTMAQDLYISDERALFYVHIDSAKIKSHDGIKVFDGLYQVYLDSNLTNRKYSISVKSRMIDGVFKEYNESGNVIKAGRYFMDSLWSFIILPEDTTFKVGTWWFENDSIVKYDIKYYERESIFYDNNSYWENGQVKRQQLIDKRGRTIEYSVFNPSGKIVSKASLVNDSSILFISYNFQGQLQQVVLDNPSNRIMLRYMPNCCTRLEVYECEKNSTRPLEKYVLYAPGRYYYDPKCLVQLNKSDEINYIKILRKYYFLGYKRFRY